MSRLIAVDPGVNYTGVAWFEKGVLTHANYYKGLGFKDTLKNLLVLGLGIPETGLETLVCEWPQIYRERSQQKRDPNDLLPLAAIHGILIGLWEPSDIRLVRPREWKGQKKTNPTANWILSRLGVEEKASIEHIDEFLACLWDAESAGRDVLHPTHNTLDAVGIGLFVLGRLERKRVIAR